MNVEENKFEEYLLSSIVDHNKDFIKNLYILFPDIDKDYVLNKYVNTIAFLLKKV